MAILNTGDFPIDPNTTTGTDLANRLNRLASAIDTNNANATRPTYIKAGGLWTQSNTGGGFTLYFYDGTRDVAIGTVTAAGVGQFGGGGAALAPAHNAATTYQAGSFIYDAATSSYLQAKNLVNPGPYNPGDWQAVTNVVGAFLPLAGGTATGPISVPAGATGNQVPRANEVITKTGGTLTGPLNVPAGATGAAVPQAQEVVHKAGDRMTGNLEFYNGSTLTTRISSSGPVASSAGFLGYGGTIGSTAHIGLEGGSAVVGRSASNSQLMALQAIGPGIARVVGQTATDATQFQVAGSGGGIMFENVAGHASFANRLAMGWSGSNVAFRVDTAQIPAGTLSDARVKENINPVSSMTDTVMALRPVTFDYKSNDQFPLVLDKANCIGFVAQEVQKVIPQAVTGGVKPEDMFGLDPMPIIAALVKTVQEMDARIKALEARK